MITLKADHRLFTVYPDAVVENKAALAGTVVPSHLAQREVMEAEGVGLKLQATASPSSRSLPPPTHGLYINTFVLVLSLSTIPYSHMLTPSGCAGQMEHKRSLQAAVLHRL